MILVFLEPISFFLHSNFSFLSKNLILLAGTLPIPKTFLQSNVDYKYVVLCNDDDSVFFYEVLYTSSRVAVYDRNRLFEISSVDLLSSKYFIMSILFIDSNTNDYTQIFEYVIKNVDGKDRLLCELMLFFFKTNFAVQMVK